ncbi:MAG: PARG family protein [Lachnospiraceae bacterium]
MDRKLMAKETLEIIEKGYYMPDSQNNNSQKTEKGQYCIKAFQQYAVPSAT